MTEETEIIGHAVESSGVLGQIFQWVITSATALMGLLLGGIWKKHNEEIAAIKHSIEVNRVETRDAIIALHDRVEQSNRDAVQRHIDLMNRLNERNR